MNVEYGLKHGEWDRIHSLGSPIFKLRKELVLPRLPAETEKGISVLDAGCGTGIYTLEMLRRGFRVTSFDVSEYAVKKLFEMTPEDWKPRLRTYVCDTEHFPAEEKFDFILLSEVLEHVKNDVKTLSDLALIMKPSGRVLITLPFDPGLFSPHDISAGHFRRYTLEGAKHICSEAGLRVTDSFVYGFPFLYFYYRFKLRFVRKIPFENSGAAVRTGIGRIFNFFFDILLSADRIFLNTGKGVGIVLLCQKK